MKKLTLSDIQAVDDLKPVEYYVDEWDGYVYIGRMTVQERLDFDSKYSDDKGVFKKLNDPQLTYDLLKICVKTHDGNHMFTSQDDLNVLKGKNAKVVNKLFIKALSVNYMDTDAVDDIKKNSTETS